MVMDDDGGPERVDVTFTLQPGETVDVPLPRGAQDVEILMGDGETYRFKVQDTEEEPWPHEQ